MELNIDKNSFPASFAQRRLWFIQQMEPRSSAYNMLVTTPVPPGFTHAMIQSAVNVLCQHHENLRTCFAFDSEQVKQCVLKSCALTVELHQVDNVAQMSAITGQSVAHAFDLSQAPLARVQLFEMREGSLTLSLIVHHIIADARTLEILLENLASVLQLERAGLPLALPETQFEYADYSDWQHRRLSGARLEALTEYWAGRLTGTEELRLPYDRERHGVFSSRGGVVPFDLDPDTAGSLRTLAASLKTTVFTVLLSALTVTLHQFSGQKRFVVGIPVDGRSRTEFERIAGLFVNSITFGVEILEDVTFEAHLLATAESLLGDLSNQEMPFDLLVDTLQTKRQSDRNPLFQVMLQVQMPVMGPEQNNEAFSEVAAAIGKPGPQLDADNLSSQLDLSLILFDHGRGAIHGGAIYATDLFDESTIGRLVSGFELLLENVMQMLNRPLNNLQLLDQTAMETVLALGEGETRDDFLSGPLASCVTSVAMQYADKVAIIAGERQITYGEFIRCSRDLADRMQNHGIGAGSVVAINLPRCIDLAVAVLATVSSGATYLILGPELPAARREHILADCDAAMVVTSIKAEGTTDAPAFDLKSLQSSRPSTCFHHSQLGPASYLIYTSGTSGDPKGVAIAETALVNHMNWIINQFNFTSEDRFLQRTPLSFDASVWEFWAPLMVGATMIMSPDRKGFDPDMLLDQITQNNITVLQLVPCLLRTLVSSARIPTDLSLRLLFCGGERLNSDVCQLAHKALDVDIVNLYGPSETTIDVTYHVCSRNHAGTDMPIGRPIPNVNVKILDSRRYPVPQGVIGELYIGGASVGIGYVRLEQLNSERFINDPYKANARLFKSGDLARFGSDGELYYCGRIDEQVKIRGNRIELQEIDALVRRHTAVTHAATVVQQQGTDRARLVTFVKLDERVTGDASREILTWLRSQLPAHSVPAFVAVVDQIPLTAQGKTDTNALKSREVQPACVKSAEPATRLQKCICRVFADALHIESVGIDDDFFDLGGNSLLVVSVCNALSTALNVHVNVVDLFEFPCARLLAEKTASKSAASADVKVPASEGVSP